MLMALTREISPTLESCRLTHVTRVPIDLERARAQHAAYEWALVEEGCTIRRLDAGPDMPDSVFIEDIAVVLDEGAVVCRPGAASRRIETSGVIDALARHGRPLQRWPAWAKVCRARARLSASERNFPRGRYPNSCRVDSCYRARADERAGLDRHRSCTGSRDRNDGGAGRFGDALRPCAMPR